jgi:DNA replication protein DnaC
MLEATMKNNGTMTHLADGILDRLVHNAHRIEMRGDSMRKVRTKPSG